MYTELRTPSYKFHAKVIGNESAVFTVDQCAAICNLAVINDNVCEMFHLQSDNVCALANLEMIGNEIETDGDITAFARKGTFLMVKTTTDTCRYRQIFKSS